MTQIAVLDYGVGNVRSVVRMCEKVGAHVELTRDRDHVLAADGLIVPGVGDFDTVIRALRACQGDDLIRQRLAGGKGVLGICVGLQVLFSSSTERGCHEPGLGLYSGTVEGLKAPVVPHMGWSQIQSDADSALWKGLIGSRFYFAHSFAVPAHEAPRVSATGGDQPRIALSCHGQSFVAAIDDGPLTATQFHPEKSGACGEAFFRQWMKTTHVSPKE